MSESPEDAPVPGEEERDFQKVLALVGGKERIYLVSDACGRDEVGEDDADVLREFMRDMFHGYAESPGACQPSAEDERSGGALTSKADHEQPPARNGHRQRTATRDSDVSSRRRAIDAPLIIFLFRQTFVSRGANARCVKEILKDVRARAQRAGARRPALIGLIRTRLERAETHLCAQSLERVIRAVFHAHPPETIWVGCFTPRAESATLSIKKNACRVLQASQKAANTPDPETPLLRPFQCLCWARRRGAGGSVSSSPSSRRRGDAGSVEESIPLKTTPLSAGPQGESATGAR